MIATSKEAGEASRKFFTHEITEAIKGLTVAQQEELLGVICKWKNDNRDHHRITCLADAIFSDNKLLAKGTIVNISMSGLFLHSETAINLGNVVIVCFENPFTEKQVKVKGHIVRKEKDGFAIKFDGSLDSI